MVVDKGFEPFRCSPSDHSPGLIRPSRTPVLSTIEIFGSRSQIRTDGFRDLQSLALGHSAIRPLVLLARIELAASSLPRKYSTTELQQLREPGRTFLQRPWPCLLYAAFACMSRTSFRRSAA